MDGPRHERRQHFRGKARPGRIMHVRYRTSASLRDAARPGEAGPGGRSPAHAAWLAAETRDIGVGGAFIVTPHQLPVGTTLTIEVRLPTSDQAFALPAVVRWASATEGGMGVQFVDVEVDILLELNDYFSTLT